jgi:tetratricopeptide (TPR) repeat protein
MENKVLKRRKFAIYIAALAAILIVSITAGFYYYRKTLKENLVDSKIKTASRYVESGEFDDALKIYSEVRKLKRNIPVPELKKMAVAAIGSGNKKLAKQIFEEILNKNPKDAEAHFELALIYYEDRETTQAIQLAEKAASLKATYIAPRHFLAKQFMALGEYEKAKNRYAEILRIDPEIAEREPAIVKDIAYCFEKLRDYPQAVFYYQKALQYLPGDSEIIEALKRLRE